MPVSTRIDKRAANPANWIGLRAVRAAALGNEVGMRHRAFGKLVASLFAWLAAFVASDAALAADEDMASTLSALHRDGHFSGAVIVGRDERIVFQGAAGMADLVNHFTLDTLADGGSLAKTVTAAAIWRLIDQGRISLDDPVRIHLDEFPYPGVTIRHLLAHTGGLPDYDAFAPIQDSGEVVDNIGLQKFMARSSASPLHEPGTRFRYCNICYDTLALVIERVSRASYAQFAIEGQLRESGANRAFLRPVRFSEWRGPRTLGFRSSLPKAELFDVFDNEAIYGGSNIYFSARDLHAWAKAWSRQTVLSSRVLDPALAPASIGDHALALNLSSWYCSHDRERCYYTGHHQGFFSFVYWDSARQHTAVLVSNGTMPAPIQPWLMRALVAIADGRANEPPPVLPPSDQEVDIPAMAGKYHLAGIGEVEITVSETERPEVRVAGGPRYDLYQVGHAVLYSPGLDAYLSFRQLSPDAQPALLWNSVFLQAEGVRITL